MKCEKQFVISTNTVLAYHNVFE